MSHWWSSKQELILVQIWVVLLLSHIVYALRDRIATAANCEPFEVSVPLLVKLLPQLCSHSELSFERLVQEGHHLGLLRASPHLALLVPLVELSSYRPVPPDLPWLRPGHAPSAPRARAPKPTTRVSGYPVQRQKRQASKEIKAIRAAQAKAARATQLLTGITRSTFNLVRLSGLRRMMFQSCVRADGLRGIHPAFQLSASSLSLLSPSKSGPRSDVLSLR